MIRSAGCIPPGDLAKPSGRDRPGGRQAARCRSLRGLVVARGEGPREALERDIERDFALRAVLEVELSGIGLGPAAQRLDEFGLELGLRDAGSVQRVKVSGTPGPSPIVKLAPVGSQTPCGNWTINFIGSALLTRPSTTSAMTFCCCWLGARAAMACAASQTFGAGGRVSQRTTQSSKVAVEVEDWGAVVAAGGAA